MLSVLLEMTKMSNKNQRLYQCDDCGAKRFIRRVELSRAAKPRCTACGCTRLEMCSAAAVEEMADIATARLAQRGQTEKKKSGM